MGYSKDYGASDGPVMVCPNEGKTGEPHGACRSGSPYFSVHPGRCHRCNEVLVEDVDENRVALRRRLYEILPFAERAAAARARRRAR